MKYLMQPQLIHSMMSRCEMRTPITMKIMSSIVHSAHPRSRVSAILQPLCPRVLRAYQHLLFHLSLSRQETCRRNRMRSDANCVNRSLHHHVKKARDWLYRSRSFLFVQQERGVRAPSPLAVPRNPSPAPGQKRRGIAEPEEVGKSKNSRHNPRGSAGAALTSLANAFTQRQTQSANEPSMMQVMML